MELVIVEKRGQRWLLEKEILSNLNLNGQVENNYIYDEGEAREVVYDKKEKIWRTVAGEYDE